MHVIDRIIWWTGGLFNRQCKHPLYCLCVERDHTLTALRGGYEITYHLFCAHCSTQLEISYFQEIHPLSLHISKLIEERGSE